MHDPREITAEYRDPLDAIWLRTAKRCGLDVVRSDTVFASFDGDRTLLVCSDEHFDPDDCLAQMIFHELCHALVMGAAGRSARDWGLENVDSRDAVYEHACHRLQATLADRYGLREMLAPTTDHRSYYDKLPPDPLAPCDDLAVELATEGWHRARHGPWTEALSWGLSATQRIADVVSPEAEPGSLWARYSAPHRLGLPPGSAERLCGDCTWAAVEEEAQALRCLMASRAHNAPAPPVTAEEMGCALHEPKLTAESCGACGACCREAYHAVEVADDDPVHQALPAILVQVDGRWQVRRSGDRCSQLLGELGSFHCQSYAHRPECCRDFEWGSENCREARQRVGLPV